jgi:hypothetical protein
MLVFVSAAIIYSQHVVTINGTQAPAIGLDQLFGLQDIIR